MKAQYAKYRDADTLMSAFKSGELIPETRCSECIMHGLILAPGGTNLIICGMSGAILRESIVGCLGGAKLPKEAAQAGEGERDG